MESSVGTTVGNRVEFDRVMREPASAALDVRLLGPMTVLRNGEAIALPSSRKVRALLAFLALSTQPVTRSRLCGLLWEIPNDPRGELRWCLSKLRRVVDSPDRRRIETVGDTVRLDLADAFVDAVEIVRATQAGVATLNANALTMLSSLFAGDFLDGMEMDRSPAFNAWVTAERRRFSGRHTAVLEHLVGRVPGDDVFRHIDKWLELAPFDQNVHEVLLRALAKRGRIPEGEAHLEATKRLFEAEGLDHAPIRNIWRAARSQASTVVAARVAVSGLQPISQSALQDHRPTAHPSPRRASIAVMPFADRSGVPGGPAGGLVHDVISRLAKLRSLFVIAQGTVFALHERQIDPEAAGRTLNVDYIVTGTLQREGLNLTVAVELTETRTARIVWAEVFTRTFNDAFLVLDEIGNRIVSSVVSEIETVERNRAILKPPNSLDAWEAFHRGLWHMYRFEKDDNERARHFFEMAVRLDPTFARAHAGLSFTHWQNAFQGWAPREQETDRALDAAGQSLMADDRDPSAHWAMGRAMWLRGEQDQAVSELETAVDLSPNFALGHYTLAFFNAQMGDPNAAIGSSDHSRHLSPFDPMLFAMLASRALALVRLGRFEEAAEWASKAARRPNVHPHVIGTAAYSLALAGRLDEARASAAAIRKRLPDYTIDNYLRAFRLDENGAEQFRKGAKLVGMA